MIYEYLRNPQQSHRFGPYDEKTLLYVNNGQVLKQDKALADGDSLERTVGFYLKQSLKRVMSQTKEMY